MPQLGFKPVLRHHGSFQMDSCLRFFHKHKSQIFPEAFSPHRHIASGLQREAAALEHNLVLPAHQVGIHQRQPGGLHPLAHGGLALAAFARMERRSVQHHQQLCTGCFGCLGRGIEPGILADQQPAAQAGTTRIRQVEHHRPVAGHKVPALVEHLVIGQVLLGVGVQRLAVAQHRGGIEQLGHRHAAPARTGLLAHGMTHHQREAIEGSRFGGDGLQGIIAGIQKSRTQEQVLRRIAAQGQLGGDQQLRTLGMGFVGSGNDAAHVASEVAHHKVELGQTNFERHVSIHAPWRANFEEDDPCQKSLLPQRTVRHQASFRVGWSRHRRRMRRLRGHKTIMSSGFSAILPRWNPGTGRPCWPPKQPRDAMPARLPPLPTGLPCKTAAAPLRKQAGNCNW